ncbi:MAG: endonuclease/exonuclease/phosphatase family protein [Phycisphaerae bacterium]|jgi:endonuclease/exonuclease/phosphatase family metal-dependent hydrolase|nr:endonuclease/exonuclease/phosphatase family protein [Phycisphaerae bacterium]
MLRTSALVCLIALAATVFAGCNFRTTRKGAPPTGPHFSVMTYNVNYGMPGAADAVGAIRETDADIVCLQEITPAWQRYLTAALSQRYPHRRYKHRGGAGGMGILSKRPFRDVAYTEPQAGWFPSWIIEADTPLGPVHICNVHLRPPLSDRGSISPSAYMNTPEIHRREIAEAYGHMDSKRPRLVVGDFNENDSGGGIAWLGKRGFTDALSQFDTSSNTWQWRVGAITLRNRFDHILHSGNLHSTSAWVVAKGKSDHRPVVAIIERAGLARDIGRVDR